MRGRRMAFGIIALALAAGCGGGEERPASGKPLVVVSVPPQAYFVGRIAGEAVEVEVLVQPGQDPHTFSPTAQQIVRLERAAVVFRIGMPFEKILIDRIAAAHPELRIVDANRDLPPGEALAEPAHGHAEQHELEDERDGLDPHTWMSPPLAARQAAVIAEALAELEPEHAERFAQNLAMLRADLEALDGQIVAMLQPVQGGTFYVFHPAFGYFARAYGLRQEAVETGGKSPSARHLAELIEQARARGVRTIFVQRQFSDRAARTIAEQIGAEVVSLDDLSPDYLNNLLDVARKIRAALEPAATAPGEEAGHG